MRSSVQLALSLLVCTGCGTNDRILGNVADPQLLAGVTKFRSCCGHSFAVGESNRSMKHYLVPRAELMGRDDSLPLHSPCTGEVVSTSDEENRIACLGGSIRGKQFRIVCRARPDVSVRIFHVNPVRGPGSVRAGELLGYADLRACPDANGGGYADVDVAVEKLGSLYSYFEWLKDGAFGEWAARGLASREAAVISREERDAHPCDFNQESMACEQDTIRFP